MKIMKLVVKFYSTTYFTNFIVLEISQRNVFYTSSHFIGNNINVVTELNFAQVVISHEK